MSSAPDHELTLGEPGSPLATANGAGGAGGGEPPVSPPASAAASDPDPFDPRWRQLWPLARLFAGSRFSPYGSPEDVFFILMAGADLGLSPMQALRGIWIDEEGLTQLKADTMAAIVLRSPLCIYLYPEETTRERCTYVTLRQGYEQPARYTYTLVDATHAGLMGSEFWQRYPGAMCRARALSFICRAHYPDLVGGFYDPVELLQGLTDPGSVVPPAHTDHHPEQDLEREELRDFINRQPGHPTPPHERHGARGGDGASGAGSASSRASSARHGDMGVDEAVPFSSESPTASLLAHLTGERAQSVATRRVLLPHLREQPDEVKALARCIEEADGLLGEQVESLFIEWLRAEAGQNVCQTSWRGELPALSVREAGRAAILVSELSGLSHETLSLTDLYSPRAAHLLARYGVFGSERWERAKDELVGYIDGRLEALLGEPPKDADRSYGEVVFSALIARVSERWSHLVYIPYALLGAWREQLRKRDDTQLTALYTQSLPF